MSENGKDKKKSRFINQVTALRTTTDMNGEPSALIIAAFSAIV